MYISLSSHKLRENQRKSSGLEASLVKMIEEHNVLDAQSIAEHEEEIRALRQQREHFMLQLDGLDRQVR